MKTIDHLILPEKRTIKNQKSTISQPNSVQIRTSFDSFKLHEAFYLIMDMLVMMCNEWETGRRREKSLRFTTRLPSMLTNWIDNQEPGRSDNITLTSKRAIFLFYLHELHEISSLKNLTLNWMNSFL